LPERRFPPPLEPGMILRERLSAKAIAYLRTSPFVIGQENIKRTTVQAATSCAGHHKKPKAPMNRGDMLTFARASA
jgi:hypothetical protein